MKISSNKKILFIILLLALLLIIFVSMFLFKQDEEVLPEEEVLITDEFQNIPRRTDVTNNFPQTQTPAKIETNATNTIILSSSPDTLSALGEEVFERINKNLSDWETNQDQKLLNEAFILSNNVDNEMFLEPWREIIKSNSLKMTYNEEDKEALLGAYLVFDWFINLSGDFDTLSIEKRKEISNEYFKLEEFFR